MPRENKPCPFCGKPARTFMFNGTLQAQCSGKFDECAGTDVIAPIAMWNQRTPARSSRQKSRASAQK